ncbi:MAG TPA: PKD-like domain-containing protein [Flavobacteriaceae bacterium]|nr:PKD-like domain-containing protein [Flavobacteriaceae bacterium]
MELSDAAGSFANPVQLSQKTEFFLPIMNGVIPSGTPMGTGYKIRITSDLDADNNGIPDIIPAETNTFAISAPGTTPVSFDISFPNPPPNFIDCINNNFFGFLNRSETDTTSNIDGQIGNTALAVTDFTMTLYPYDIVNQQMNIAGGITIVPGTIIGGVIVFNLPSGLPTNFYVLEIIGENSGLSSSESYIYHFNTGSTGIANLSSEQECVGNQIDFEISINSMIKNYPGSKYILDFGDGTPVLDLTHAQIYGPQVNEVSGSKWSHTYNNTTCDSPHQILNTADGKYYFQLQFKLLNKGIVSCNAYDENGNGAPKWVNISLPPTPDFLVADAVCIMDNLVATENVTPGAYGFAQNCLTIYNIEWKLDPPTTAEISVSTFFPSWIDANGNLTVPSSILQTEGPGCYIVTLIASNPEGCTSPQEISKTVSVQEAVSTANFTYTPQPIICPGETVSFTNTSVVTSGACQEFSYNWTVTPVPGTPATPSGYTFVIDPSQPTTTLPQNYENPQITFTQEGQYDVTLNISNACGPVSVTQTITVTGNPTVGFTPDFLTICEDIDNQGYTIDFSDPAFSPTYSTGVFAPTSYTWTVSGTGVTAADYAFVNSTNASSEYPMIQFNNYKTYVITVLVNGNCSLSNQATFTFEYKRAPKITNIVFQQTLCSGQSTTAMALSSDLGGTSFQWTINAPPEISGYPTTPTSGTSIPSMTLINSTNQPLDLIFTVEPMKDGCVGISKDFIFTVNPTPVIPNQNAVICSGETFVVDPVDNQPPATPQTTIVPNNTTYTWTVTDNPNVTGDADQPVPQNEISQLLTNLTNTTQTVFYTVTPISGANGNCVGTDFTVEVTVEPKPTITNITGIEICSEDIFTVSPVNNAPVEIVPNNTTYTWTVADNPDVTGDSDEATPQTDISQQLTNTNNIPEIVVYTVTPVSGNCTGQSFTVEVTVNPSPVVPNQNVVICSGNSFSIPPLNNPASAIIPTGTTYTWTVVDNLNVTGDVDEPNPQINITQQLFNLTNTSQTVVYTVTPTSGDVGNCTGNSFSLSVVVDPVPVIPNQNLTLCSGGTFSVAPTHNPPTAIVPASTLYTWTVQPNPDVAGEADETTPQPQISQHLVNNSAIPQDVVYTVTPISGSCVGADFTVTVTVDPNSVIQDKNAVICSGQTFTVTPVTDASSTVLPGTTYTWTVVDNPNVTGDVDQPVPQPNISQQLTNTSNIQQTVIYTVTPHLGACQGNDFTITVEVDPVPVIQDQIVEMCSEQTFTVIPLNNPPASVVPNPTTYTWTVIDNPNVTGDVDQPVPQPNISQQLTNISNLTQTVTYTVTPVSGICMGQTFTVTVVINPIPVIDPIPAQTICSGTSFTGVAPTSNVSGTTYSWVLQNTNVPGTISGYPTSGTGNLSGSSILNSGTAPYVLNYEFTPTFANCDGTPEVFQLTVNPAPSVQFDIVDQDICSGAASTAVNISSQTPGVSISWQINTIPTGLSGVSQTTGTNQIPSFTLTNTTNNPINLIIEANAETSGSAVCQGSINTYTITIYPEIAITTQPIPSQSICEGGIINTLTVAYSGGIGNPSYQWYENTVNSNSGGTIIPGATTTTYDPPPFASTGTFYFYAVVSLDGSGCGSVNSNVAVVNVMPDPTIDTQPLANQTQCVGSTANQLQVAVSGGLGILSYQWYSNTTNSTTGGTAIPGETNPTYIPPTSTIGTLFYYVVVTQSVSGCETTSTVSEVEVVPSPSFDQQPTGSVICLNGDAPDLAFSYTDGTGTPSYQWYSNTTNSNIGGTIVPGATAPTFDPPTGAVGNMFYYVVISFNIGGCSTITSNPAEVQVVPLPTINTQPVPVQDICEGGTVNTLTVSYLDGTGNPSYQWYENTVNSNTGGTAIPGATSASYDPPPFATAGTFYFYAVVNLDGEGCGLTVSDVATINVVPDPTIDTQPLAQQIQCVGSPADQLQAFVSGGLGTISYQWYSNTTNSNIGGTAITGETNPAFIPSTNTIGTFYYYVVATQNVSGCEVISAVSEVEVVPTPSFDQHPVGSATCLNGDAPDLTFSYVDGTGSVSYQWYSNTVNSNTGGTAVPGATMQTYDPPTGTLGSMFYYVEIIFGDTGCGAIISDPAEVVIIPSGEIDPVADIVVCNLEIVPSIVFTTPDTSGNTFFQWTNSNPSIGLASSGTGDLPSFTAQNSSTGPVSATITVTPVYSLGGTDCQGAPTSFTISIGGEVQVSAVFSDYNGFGVSCFNSQDGNIDVTAQGGAPFSSAPFYQYSWSGPNGFTSTSKFIDNIEAGNYVLTITDAAGCSYDFTYTLTAPDEIIINDDAVQDVLCNGEFNGNILVTPTGGAGSYTYVWMKNGLPAAITQDFQNIGPGLYTLIVTDANGCTQTKDYTISEPAPIQITVVSQASLLCFGDTDTGSIDIDVSGGTPLETAPGVFEYVYSWIGPNGFSSIIQDIDNVGAGIYTVTVYDNLGCEASLDIEITEPDPLVINFDVTNESCKDAEDGSITVQVQGGTPPYSYLWSNGATTSTISNLAPGLYDLLVTDANACEESIQIQVEDAPEIQIDAIVNNISCFGFNDGSIEVIPSGGNPVSETPPVYNYDFYWQGPGNFTSIQALIENLVPGIYTVTVTDALGCEATENYTIVEPPVLEVTYQSTDVFCFGVNDGTIDLTVSGGTPPYSFLWSNGALSEDIENLSPGNYEVSVSDTNGCTVELSIEIKDDYLVVTPPPTGEPIQEFCIENQPEIRDIQVEGLEIIWYADPFYSEVLPPEHLLGDGEVVYAQNFDESNGCYSEELLKVEIIVHDTNLKVYNLITVDGNNMNSRLKVEGIEGFPKNKMSIFNRYGKLVWKINDYNNTDRAFRGMANQGGLVVDRGNFLPSGTYYYVLEYPNPCNQTTLDGFLQIDNKN